MEMSQKVFFFQATVSAELLSEIFFSYSNFMFIGRSQNVQSQKPLNFFTLLPDITIACPHCVTVTVRSQLRHRNILFFEYDLTNNLESGKK